MRRLLGLSAAFAAALALVALSAGPALASHVQCGDVITQHTTLDSDLDCTGNGLVVSGSDLTLDLAGHTIRGDGNGFDDIGIQLDGSKITVEDGRVQDFAFDVQLGSVPPSSSSENVLRRLQVANGNGVIGVGGERNRIEDSRFVNTSVSLSEARNALVQRNSFDKFGVGIDQFNGGGSVVRDNVGGALFAQHGQDLTVEGNRFPRGIEIYGLRSYRIVGNTTLYMRLFSDAANSVVERNLVNGEGYEGIFVWANLNHSEISNNTVVGSGIGLRGASDNRVERNSILRGGILLTDDADRNLISRNSITGSPGSGIALTASLERSGTTRNVIERNLVRGSAGNGVLLGSFRYYESVSGQTDTVLRDNVIRDNALDGVAVQEGSTGTLLEGNKLLRNDDGLDVKDPSSSIFGNRAWFNGDLGIEAVPGVTGSGNSAKHNGNPTQCVPSYLCQGPGKPKT